MEVAYTHAPHRELDVPARRQRVLSPTELVTLEFFNSDND